MSLSRHQDSQQEAQFQIFALTELGIHWKLAWEQHVLELFAGVSPCRAQGTADATQA